MSIVDKISSLLPRHGERRESIQGRDERLAVRDDVDRWLRRFFEEAPDFPASSGRGWTPSADVDETDKEVIVTMEVPGLRREDLDLTLTPEGLMVRGEKREGREDRRKDVYVAERRYGAFVRTIPLPPGVDAERAEARVKDGVLTVRFPRLAARDGSRRVPIGT
jgi:HSP20 family protein